MNRVEEVKQYFKSIESEFDTARASLSSLDQQEQQILHYIEFGKYNAAQGSKLLKRLKEVRLQRRVPKKQIEELGVILSHMKKGGVLNMRYNPKTNFPQMRIEDVLK